MVIIGFLRMGMDLNLVCIRYRFKRLASMIGVRWVGFSDFFCEEFGWCVV